jgi:O-antigen/teichoic acid export membrane protein
MRDRFQIRGTAVRRASIETVLTGFGLQMTLMVSGILVARILGVEDRGHLALMTLFPLILVMTGTLGLPLATTYYLAQRANGRQILRAVRRSTIMQAVSLTVLYAAIVWFVFSDSPTEVRLAAAYTLLGIPALIVWFWGQGILQGQRRFRSFNLLRLSQPGLYAAALVVVFIAGGADIVTAAIIWVATSLIGGVWTLAVALRGLPDEGTSPPALGEMYRFGLKGMVGWVSPLETLQLDQVVVGLALSPTALGLYVVAAAFTNLTRLFIPQSLGMVAYPHIASAGDPERACRTIWRFFFATLIVSCLIVAVLEGVIGWVVPFLFGDAFSGSVPLARVLLIGSVFLGLRRVLTDGTRGAGRPGLGTIAEACTAALAVPALVVGLHHGVEGVAWALTIAYGLGLAIMVALTISALSNIEPGAAPGSTPELLRRADGGAIPAGPKNVNTTVELQLQLQTNRGASGKMADRLPRWGSRITP